VQRVQQPQAAALKSHNNGSKEEGRSQGEAYPWSFQEQPQSALASPSLATLLVLLAIIA
jgi:hypothetical protein